MKIAFADTGYWIALFDPRDGLHSRAIDVSRSLNPSTSLLTSELVLVEILDGFASHGATLRRTAAQIIEQLAADRHVEIIYQTPDLFRAAVRLYETHADKGWGLTDCVSFSIMRDRGIVHALAYNISAENLRDVREFLRVPSMHQADLSLHEACPS